MNKSETYNDRIKATCHRSFIGGGQPEMWHHIGKMQYHYLISHGLESHHKFLDIGCGSLRLGQWIIPMLDEGNYYGLDGTEKLIELGIKKEMLHDIVDIKKPHFSFNHEFDFSFIDSFDFAIAQSVFTHLTLEYINLCFQNLKGKMHNKSKFYCTFFEGGESNNPRIDSDPNQNWFYNFETLEKLAFNNELKLTYIGDWQHPRNQKLFLATLN